MEQHPWEIIEEESSVKSIEPPTRTRIIEEESSVFSFRSEQAYIAAAEEEHEEVPTNRGPPIQGQKNEALISASLGAMVSVVEKLEMLLVEPPRRRCKLPKDGIHLLNDDVGKLREYLENISELEYPTLTAKCWMNEVCDLFYDMDDYIDSLIFGQPEDRFNSTKATRSLCKWFSHVKTPKTQVNIAETLSEFRMYVQMAIERHQRYNLPFCTTMRSTVVSIGPMLLPTPYEETANIVIDGRMNEFITSVVTDEEHQLKVLSILGSACLGKTTLARVLYNRFGKQYNCRAFIRVSRKPDMKRIFCDMLSQLMQQDFSQDCMEIDLIEDIKKYVQIKGT